MYPHNGKRGSHYNGEGEVNHEARCKSNPERIVKNKVQFSICVENDIIIESRWQIFGDPVAIAAASWCVCELKGKDINDISPPILQIRLTLALEVKEELDVRAGITAVLQALTLALEDYSSKNL